MSYEILKKKMKYKYDPKKSFLKTYDHDLWLENEKSSDTKRKSDKEESVDLPDKPTLEGDEEVKLEPKETIGTTGTGLKILTPNKLQSRDPILLTRIKAGNNSYKLKIEIRQILYLLYQHNKMTRKVYNKLIKSL